MQAGGDNPEIKTFINKARERQTTTVAKQMIRQVGGEETKFLSCKIS